MIKLTKDYTVTSVFKNTDDDWYGNYAGNQVKLTLILNTLAYPAKTYHRVCVWGNDDFGMEHDFKENKTQEAIDMFNMLNDLPTINQETLKKLKFELT